MNGISLAADLGQAGSVGLASFLASLVECVEALTVVVAVGVVRGWRWALAGALAAGSVLVLASWAFGTTMAGLPLDLIRAVTGVLLLLFGIRWLRKAVLRAAGIIPLHDETLIYERATGALRRLPATTGRWDPVAFSSCFKITLLEGLEVVFIVLAMGAGGRVGPAAAGAALAVLCVVLLGLALHRPLALVPENTLKFAVGVVLSGFGTVWTGESMAAEWPGGDWALLYVGLAYLGAGLLGIRLVRVGPDAAPAGPVSR